MKVSFSNKPVEPGLVRLDEVPDGTLLELFDPGTMFHGNIYLKAAGTKNLINLTANAVTYGSWTGSVFKKLPAGFTATLVQDGK